MERTDERHGDGQRGLVTERLAGADRRLTDPGVPSDEQAGLGLFLYAHLRLAADADAELASLGLHRTHHRILYLVAQAPGTSVGEIVALLSLTPQGVQGPMQRLIRDGLIEQRSDDDDRRKRRLYVTDIGTELHLRIASRQHWRLLRAYEQAGVSAVRGFLRVMSNLSVAADQAD